MLKSILWAGRAAGMIGVAAVGLTAMAGPSGAAALPDEAGRVVLAQAQPGAAAAPGSPTQRVEATITQLHQKLQITPAQEAPFKALANVMRANARAMPSPPATANPSAVDDLRGAIRDGEQEVAGLKRLLPALDALYAAMTPAQKKTADAVFRQGPGE